MSTVSNRTERFLLSYIYYKNQHNWTTYIRKKKASSFNYQNCC